MRESFRGGSAGGSGSESVAGRHGVHVGLEGGCCEEKDDGVHEDERLKRSVLLVLLRCTQRG